MGPGHGSILCRIKRSIRGRKSKKIKTFQKILYVGENRRQKKRRHKCQEDEKLSFKRIAKGIRGWGYTWDQKPAKGELVSDSA